MSQENTSVTPSPAYALPTKKLSLIQKFANKFSIEPEKLLTTLKSTAFRQRDNADITNEQMAALLIVADQYNLNPFTKEIFAYPDKSGIVPVVSIDGWSRIVNAHDEFDGVEFRYSEETLEHKGKNCHEWIEAVFYRKDRKHPIVVREKFREVVRTPNFPTPWDSHPSRMHRHKTYIQGARIAFGFAGIYDEDEAERIIEGHVVESEPSESTRDINARLQSTTKSAEGHESPENETPEGTEERPPAPGTTPLTADELLTMAQQADSTQAIEEVRILNEKHLAGQEKAAVTRTLNERLDQLIAQQDAIQV